MREFSLPGAVEFSTQENLTTALWQREKSHPDSPILSYRNTGESFSSVTYGHMAATVRRIAAGFIALGIPPKSRICIFSPTRFEFTLTDYAIWAAGCVSVPIYETSSPDQVEWVVQDSGAVAIVCGNKILEAVFAAKAGLLGACHSVFTMDAGGIDDLMRAGADISDELVIERATSVRPSDLATLIYTSGTTGPPKGCALRAADLVFTARSVLSVLGGVINETAVTLLFLPLAHSFARLAQVGCIIAGCRIAFSSGPTHLMDELMEVRPTWLFAVPRMFEKIYNASVEKAERDGRGRIFRLASRVAEDYSRAAMRDGVPLALRLQHVLFDRLVYRKIRGVLGGRVAHAVSGGAALGERLGHFFSGAGITILEGYGLTETSAAATVNRPGAIRIGTVGQPIPGVSIRVTDNEEILIRGRVLFGGYWNGDEATRQVVDEEAWLHTGDLGHLDVYGFLSITGRSKELIVTSGGKNVAPLVLEDRVRAHRLISQCMVVGDGRPFIAALVTLDEVQYARWLAQRGRDRPASIDANDRELRAAVQEAIDYANQAVSQAEAIRTFSILAVDFSIEAQELTPTLKIRRKTVAEHYATEIESLYAAKP